MGRRRKELGRRELIELTGAAAAGAALGIGCSGDDSPRVDPMDAGGAPDAGGSDAGPPDAGPAVDAGADEPIPPGMAAVAIVRYADANAAVRRAIARAGGIAEVAAGQTVFVKPNAVHALVTGPGIVTSEAVLAAVVRVLKERGARVVVGDHSARGFDSTSVLRMSGLADAALAAGADEVYGAPTPMDDPSAWTLVQPPAYDETWSAPGGILVMRRIVEADHFVNVPVCKDHRWAVYSLSMKNLIGAVGDETRDYMHYTARMPDRLSRDIAILNQAFTPLINIVDAYGALINGGPEGVLADAVRAMPGLVLASRDRVALDAAAASLIELELSRTKVPMPDEANAFLTSTPPWRLPQVVHGIERGLGVASHDLVELRFDDVPDAAAIEAIFRTP